MNSDSDITGSVKVSSLTCGFEIFSKDTVFKVFPMKSVPLKVEEVLLNDTITIIPQNKGPFTYQWLPPYGLSSDKDFAPYFIALKNEKFSVKITDDFGCIETEEFEFFINPNIKLFVPEAFTPNGDGVNDVFQFYLIDGFYGLIKQFQIFNRQGILLFATKTVPFEWDGVGFPFGEYIYRIEYEILQKRYAKVGTISLLR